MKFTFPLDGWGHVIPRDWQADALPKILTEFQKPNPEPCVVRAVTRSGKSKIMAQFAACCQLEPHECIVVSTSTKFLVEQLSETFSERLESSGFMQGQRVVGRYYTHGKDIMTPVIITCTPSVPEVARRLSEHGRKCALWIPDECHRTVCQTIALAHAELQPATTLGFTATPFRSDEKESLFLFTKKIYDYKPDQALKDGVVVPFRTVPWDGQEGSTLDEAAIAMTAFARGPGLYNAVSIADAEVFTMKLIDAGIMAKEIHSRMPKPEIRERIEQLRTGELQALVHVSMLQEGCDFPWLRWLCMRRPCGSRVRFIQEAGRIMSSFTDPETGVKKEEAVLYDPLGIKQDFNLSYEEVLGGEYDEKDIDEAEEERKPSEKKAREFEQMIIEVMRTLVDAHSKKKPLMMTPLAAYLQELTTAFDLCGLADRKIANRWWRALQSTGKQAAKAGAMRWVTGRACVPKMHRKPLSMLVDHVPSMSRGMSSDLITIFSALEKHKKWPDLKILDRSAETAVRNHEQRAQDLVTKPFTTPQAVVTHKSSKPSQNHPLLFE